MNSLTVRFLAILVVALVECDSPKEVSTTNRVDELIEQFQMTELQEGIYYKIDYRATDTLLLENLPNRYEENHVFASSIYYLLTPNGRDYFHTLKSDEIWNYYEGDPIELTVIRPDGKLERVVLGSGVYQYTVRANSWYFASSLGNNYSLMGLIVVPGFEDSDYSPGRKKELVRLFPEHGVLIKENTEN